MRKIFILLLTCSLFYLSLEAKEIAGVTLEEERSIDGITLSLQGAGIRNKFFIDLYVASLYTTKAYDNVTSLLKADEPMCITLSIISSLISSETMEDASREGFANTAQNNTPEMNKKIETFIAVFKEPIGNNDIYDLMYIPQGGIKIYKNKTLRVSISGLDFKEALFGIWLGDKPAQESLKQALLGK
ncbi:MAG: chalcone isomerase family protein [Sulfurospirillaceae bacterium]|nr:chalcone isomerase family protein [Sulfurospirillaceae bacterium]MDD2827490.1 chalcone isomerase family protein [Sulfurospirillaceae bacterium]